MPQAVAEVEQMAAVIARQRIAVLAEIGDVVEPGGEPVIFLLGHRAAARVLALAEIARKYQLLIVRYVLIAEQQHRVFVHAGFDIPGLPRRQRLAQIDARDLTEKMRVKLPDRDSHGVSPDRGAVLPLHLREKLLPDLAMSTSSGRMRRIQALRSSCPGRGAASLRRCTAEPGPRRDQRTMGPGSAAHHAATSTRS